MRETIRLGRVGGVAVGLNWSVLAIFALIAFGLSAGRFPTAYPGAPTAAYWVAGVGAAIVFFGSLFAHEIAHALVARRDGLRVEGITLWLLGGVARISGRARTPGSEVRIAGVGPLVSLLLGLGFLFVAAGMQLAGAGGLAVEAVIWLGGINLLLALFNVIPAAPLDGGRLLRAFVWWRTGDAVKATRWASRAGQIFGGVLILLGALTFFTRANFGGLWLALIGWFLFTAASAEGQLAAVQRALAGIPAGHLMTPDPVTVPGGQSIAEFSEGAGRQHRHSSFPVVDESGAVTGLVTLNRIRPVPADRRASTSLASIACPLAEVPRSTPDEPVAELVERMHGCAEGRALVFFADGRLAGLIAPADLNRALRWRELRPVG